MGRHWKRDRFGPLDGPVKTHNMLAFDTETAEYEGYEEDPRHSKFILGVVYDGETFWEFYDQDVMIDFFLKPRWSGWHCWSCNLEYDLNAVFGNRPDVELVRNYFGGMLKGATLTLEHRTRTTRGGGTKKIGRILHFHDTLCHWKMGVKDMGKLIGLEKLDMPEQGLPNREMATYCRRDTEIVLKNVKMFQREYNDDGCTMHGSIAATSLDLYRRKYMKNEWGFRRIPRRFLEFFRQGYFGGRTENFVLGRFGKIPDRTGGPDKPIYSADVNSMYPSVMRDTSVPLLHEPHCTSSAKGLEYEGMTRAIVTVPEQMYPPLAYRHVVSRDASKLFFPIGTWEGVFTNLELRYAMEHCDVKLDKILDCVYFKESHPVFRDYVVDVYEKRKRAKEAGDEVRSYKCKIQGNSLYGKMAQIGEILTVGPRRMQGEKDFKEYGDFAARRQDGKPALYTNFIWSAYITAGSRCKLHGHLVRLAALYCDTDSAMAYVSVPKSMEMGDLSYEYETPFLEVLGCKTYKTASKTRMKGVPADAWGAVLVRTDDGGWEFEFQEMSKMKWLPTEVIYQEVSRFRGSIARHMDPNSWGIGEKRLKLAPEDRKRFFYNDGSSRPLTVEEVLAINPPWAGVEELPYFQIEGRITSEVA